MMWQPIETAPRDGTEILLYADSATVDIVRLGFWNPGGAVDESTGEITDPEPEDRGWWSYTHSVTQELLDWLHFSHWAPFEPPPEKEIHAFQDRLYRDLK